MEFTLSDKQVLRLKEWKIKQGKIICLIRINAYKKGYVEASVLKKMLDAYDNEDYTYDDKAFEYTFIITSVGTKVIVKSLDTKEELDLTEYTNW
jgi:hypothetical protein